MSVPLRTIIVVPHDPNWKANFISEAQRLRDALHDLIIDIHHIGSTSVPGIYAKPIIDIMVVVNDIGAVDARNQAMERLGYISKGEFGIAGRRFFLKGLHDRTHHVHIFQSGNWEIDKHLNFRDYMMSHPDDAKHYEELKKVLAQQFRHDIDGYCDGKDAFIKEIDRKAKEWKLRQ